MRLFYDTETTGLPDFKNSSTAEHQPYLVELAAYVAQDDGEVVASMHHIVKPDGWTIPDEAAAIHGITTERALAEGVPLEQVVAEFHTLMAMCNEAVAHNKGFDSFIMRIACHRGGAADPGPFLRAAYCTMDSSTQICKIPPTDKMLAAGFKTFKRPSMQEAYRHFFGKDFDGAHGAAADAQACMAVYFAINPPAGAKPAPEPAAEQTRQEVLAPENPLAVFEPLKKEIAEYEEINRKTVFAYDTPEGFKEAKSHIYKIRLAKGEVARVHKAAKADVLERGRLMDGIKNDLTAKLDGMIAVHEAPLLAIEAKERQRIEALETKVAHLGALLPVESTAAQYAERLAYLRGVEVTKEEYAEQFEIAQHALQSAIAGLEAGERVAIEREEKQAELETLRKEKAERDQADKERLEKEQLARQEQETVQREKEETQRKRQAYIQTINAWAHNQPGASSDELQKLLASVENQKLSAEYCGDLLPDAEKAKQSSIETIKQRINAALEAEENKREFMRVQQENLQLKQKQEAQELAERQRKEEEKLKADEEEKERQNLERRAAIEAEMLAAFIAHIGNESCARLALDAILCGKIPYTSPPFLKE